MKTQRKAAKGAAAAVSTHAAAVSNHTAAASTHVAAAAHRGNDLEVSHGLQLQLENPSCSCKLTRGRHRAAAAASTHCEHPDLVGDVLPRVPARRRQRSPQLPTQPEDPRRHQQQVGGPQLPQLCGWGTRAVGCSSTAGGSTGKGSGTHKQWKHKERREG